MKAPSYRQDILPYSAWWLFWFAAHVFVLHRVGIMWNIAVVDAGLSIALLAIAGLIILNTYRFSTPGFTNYLYRLGYVVVLTFICMTGLQWLTGLLFKDDLAYLRFFENSLPVRYAFSLLMIVFMAMLSGLQFYIYEQQENKKRKDEAEKLSRDAELSKLRQQLQPHFLFNSLNSISALAGSRPEEARKMIQQLSDFLRGTLKKDDQQLASYVDELQHLQLYLDIEKVRFGHRLNTHIESDEQSLAMLLPSLLLQPVVENAIKFGLYDTTENITISIHAEVKEKSLIITVKNPFDAGTSKPVQGTGFGLSFLQRRLYLLYARNDLLTTTSNENIFITTVKIPQTL